MKDKIFTRMGDGELVSMASEQIKEDIVAATREAAQRAEIPELTADEIEQLFDIMAEPSRAVSVASGQEVIVTDDGCSMSFYSGQDGGGVGVPMSRLQAVLTYERACAADTTSMGHSDYSFKPVKPIINFEMNEYYTASMMTTAPFLYGAQPNMGLYFQPDGPHPNPAELMPQGAGYQVIIAAAFDLQVGGNGRQGNTGQHRNAVGQEQNQQRRSQSGVADHIAQPEE